MLPLAHRHEITYVCRAPAAAAETGAAERFFADHGICAVLVADPPPRQAGIRFYARLAGNLFSPLPYSVQSHSSLAVRQTLGELARRQRVDLWHLHWLPYVEAVRGLAGRKCYEAHNVEALIWQRHYQHTRHPLKRWYIGKQWRKMQRYEQAVVAEVDQVIAVSQADARLLRQLYGIGHVAVVDNGVDHEFYDGVVRQGTAPQILYIADLQSRPNQDAVRQLLTRVFPALRQARSDARLCLVGRNPPRWMRRQASSLDGVALHANVPDLRPYLAQSAVLAVPLRIAGGSRLKILEALAAGLPVVSTRVGAEGLRLRSDEDLVVVETVDEMPAALAAALRDPQRMQTLAERGRQVVQAHYGWKPLADRLDQIWQRCIEGRGENNDDERDVSWGGSCTAAPHCPVSSERQYNCRPNIDSTHCTVEVSDGR